jgi:hypothetical protein
MLLSNSITEPLYLEKTNAAAGTACNLHDGRAVGHLEMVVSQTEPFKLDKDLL